MGQVHQFPRAATGDTFVAGAGRFIAEHTGTAWSDGTTVKYRQTLDALAGRLGPGFVLAELDTPAGAERLRIAFDERFARLAPATRARHLAALRSAIGWWRVTGRLASDPTLGWARPKVTVDTTRALTVEQVDALFRLDVPVRERTLWRMLYETAARANEILLLDVGDCDRPSNRARVTGKGGDVGWVHWQTGTARLLPHLLAGRTRGPLFLADRLPTRATPTGDLCPDTGRARLSYRRAAELFDQHTVALAHPDIAPADLGGLSGWDLHQLRHSALTHDAESGTSTPLLLARSRHASVRSLERYARPGPEAVARHVAGRDPAARRRST
ncbi:site-specific integrase [Longispora sp. NPDC051575]|uniref:site-specific integrase n=1 Tax=Longispora sp. NPDC051575 TaxID=3154943 RepID=UPI00343AF4BF